MDPATYSEPTPLLTAQRGGLAGATPHKMHPSEIALTLSADVLRLPYPPATRLVLAEVVSLYAANGCCDASNAHFMARLSIKHDAVNDALKRLEADKLLKKEVNKAAGFYRTLVPLPIAIAAKASTNPYPEKPTSHSGKPTGGTSRKNRQGLAEKPRPSYRENRDPLIGKTDTNIPLNLPVSFQETSSTSATASAAQLEKKIEVAQVTETSSTDLPSETESSSPLVAAAPPAKRSRAKSAAEPEHFAAFWAAYLRHDDRGGALKAFARLNLEDQAAAATRAANWLARRTDWVRADGSDYRPYAATWLNGKRWTELAEPLPIPSAPVSHANSSGHPLRSLNGAKPSGNAGTLARALFAHTQQQPDSAGLSPG